MKNLNKKMFGFINMEMIIVLVLTALVFYVVSSIKDSVDTYSDMKTKLAKANSDLVIAKSVITSQKLQITNLTKDLVITQRNYDELMIKKEEVTKKVKAVDNKRKEKEKQVVDSDVQLKVSGTLSEESLNKLSEIRSTDLVEHYSVLFNEPNQPSI